MASRRFFAAFPGASRSLSPHTRLAAFSSASHCRRRLIHPLVPVTPLPLFVRGTPSVVAARYTADTRRQPDEQNRHRPSSPRPATPITRGIENARERTKAVRERVRSSLPNLTPHENIYNLPNFLTVSRLIAAPAISYLILHDHNQLALALFAYAGLTDLVDGWLARKWNLQTVAGSVIDPMADKALMIILTVALAVKGALPLYLATLILGRDASLALAAIYYRYASLPAPKTFLRYWDFSLPSAEVHPTTVSKYNTLLQLLLIGAAIALPVVTSTIATTTTPAPAAADAPHDVVDLYLHRAMAYFQYVVAATTAWSGLSYAFLKDAVTILGSNEELKAKQGARGRAIIGVVFGSVVAGAIWIAVAVDDDDDSHKTEQEDGSAIVKHAASASASASTSTSSALASSKGLGETK